MSKPDSTSGDDDVASLFKRLGADGDAGYRDFGGERLHPAPPAPRRPEPSRVSAARPEPAPAPGPAAPAPAPAPAPAAPAPRGRVIHAVPAAAAQPAPARTPLQQLFDRLAGEGARPGSDSPLRRLRGS